MINFSLVYLGVFSLIISVLSFFNIIYSYYFKLYLNLDCYVFALIVSTIIGFSFLIKQKKVLKVNIYQKILTVIFGYIFLPLIIAIPYYFSIYNISFIDAFFESISGFTSTGFSIFSNIKHIDESLILWRSSSQWIGGLYFLFSIILLIDIFDNNLKKTLTNFLSFNKSETLKQFYKVLILYGLLTLGIFIVLEIFNFRTFNSFNLAMTLISSGGFLPVNDLSIILNTNIKEVIFSFMMLISFFSIFLTYNLIFIKNKNINFFQEDILLFFYFIFLIIVFFLLFNFDYNFSVIFLSLASSVSNIGHSLNESPKNLSFIFLILTIIGGSFFSTSSGVRFLKFYILFKFAINDLSFHVRPKNISPYKHFLLDISFEKLEVYKYFLSLLVFIISFFILTSLLTIAEISFEDSFKLSILTIMNTVNSPMYGLANFNFSELQFYTKCFFIIFMIIGRVELLTLLIFLKKFLFKN